MIDYKHIFTQATNQTHQTSQQSEVAAVAAKKYAEPKGDTKFIQRQVVSLEYQMTAIEGNKKTVKRYDNPLMMRALSEADVFVDEETNKFLKNKKWDKLGMWFQWTMINEYLKRLPSGSSQDFTDKVGEAFKLKCFEKVDYDNINRKVIKINYTIGDIEL